MASTLGLPPGLEVGTAAARELPNRRVLMIGTDMKKEWMVLLVIGCVGIVVLAGALSGVGMAAHDIPLYFAGVDSTFALFLAGAMVASSALIGGAVRRLTFL